jgi:AcrR family transcriptional regulator
MIAEQDGTPAAAVLPEGLGPPADVPPAIFAAALHTFLELRRLDMQSLAAELGIGRSSLYRKVGSRDHLLGEVLWYLTRRAVVRALDASAALEGRQRVIAVVEHFLRDVHGQVSLKRLLQEEPEVALRLLTSKHGAVQRRIIAVVERLLAQEEARDGSRLTLDRATLAYIIVRIGESFLYADVIADNQPDVGRAVEVIGRLLSFVPRDGRAAPAEAQAAPAPRQV